jgi:hypothetical protein
VSFEEAKSKFESAKLPTDDQSIKRICDGLKKLTEALDEMNSDIALKLDNIEHDVDLIKNHLKLNS